MAEQSMNYEQIFGRLSSSIMIVQADADLTIGYANPAFYQMLGFTEEELRYRNAGRLNAMLDVETNYKIQDFICKESENTSLLIEHMIKGCSGNIWLLTEVNLSVLEKTGCVLFVSQNIDRYKSIEYSLESLQKQDSYVFDNSDYDLLEYDWNNKNVRMVKSKWFSLGDFREDENFLEQIAKNDLIYTEDQEAFCACVSGVMKEESRVLLEMRVKAPKGNYKWARVSVGCLHYGRRLSGVCIFTDISAEKEATHKYLEETFFYQSMLSDQDAFAHVDLTEDRLLRAGGLWNIFNSGAGNVVFYKTFMDYKDRVVHPEDRPHCAEVMQCETLIQSFHNGITHLGFDFRRIIKQDKMVWMEMTMHLFANPLNQHVMALMYIKNIDEQKRQRLALEFESGHDALTQIYNRRAAEAHIKAYLNEMERCETGFLVILDIDEFKKINMERGYKAGDDILLGISHILCNMFRKYDILGRYGGDEFIILLKDVRQASKLKKRLDGVMSCIANEIFPQISCSVGIAMAGREDSFDELIKKAMMALAMAKKQEQVRYSFYPDIPEIWKKALAESTEQSTEILSEEETEFVYGLSTAHTIDSIVGRHGDIVYLVNPGTYELIGGNEVFYNRIGKSEQECRGMKCYELMHNRTWPCTFCRSANWKTDGFYTYRNYSETLERDFLIKNKLVNWHGSQVLLAIAIDLSDDKSIEEIADNSMVENSCILSGIQHMQEAEDLKGVMQNAMESIGSFFRADRVCFWNYREKGEEYKFAYAWCSSKRSEALEIINSVDEMLVSQWLHKRKWKDHFYAESQEVMLCNSYDMHNWMKQLEITNQSWLTLKAEDTILGFIEIDNIKINYQNTSFLSSFRNFMVSEWNKRLLVENLIYTNHHDGLTGVLNRGSFELYTHKYQADNVDSVAAVAANINGMKLINARMGIDGGNQCIKALANMLTLIFGQSQVFRLNGDEFLVLLTNVTQEFVEEHIRSMEDMIHNNNSFTIGIGYAWDDVEKNLTNIVEFATHAMKLNKKSGNELDGILRKDRADILADILSVIDGKRMEVFFQPKVDLRIGKVVGAEALVRMHHNEYGIVPPAKFIDTLEKNNLIRYVDLFVFEETLKILERWSAEGRDGLTVSVNFSRLTLMELDLTQTIDDIFKKYNVSKKMIEIEITESFEEGGKALLYQAAAKLYNAGYAISLDDFGTKYTNLSILSDINVNILKIDKSLIYSLVDNKKNQIILKNIITMCDELGIEVIAEGVETREQEEILNQMKCYMIQGYLYSKPIPVSEFEEKFMS